MASYRSGKRWRGPMVVPVWIFFAFDTAVFGGGGAIGLALGEPLITDGVTIDGDLDYDGFSDVVIDGQSASRVLNLTNCRGCDDQSADRPQVSYVQKSGT